MSATGTPWRHRITVQGWFLVALSVMIALVAAGTIIGAHVLSRTTAASDRLIQHIEPAQAEAYRLQATLIDQETGARGYALSADRQFLAPYTQGQDSERQSADEIRGLLPRDAQVLTDLQQIETAAAAWRHDYADPLVASVTPGQPRPLGETTVTQAKRSFDQIRALFSAQNAHLAQARDASVAELDRTRTLRNGVFSALVAAFFITAILMVILVRLLVIRPLETLRASTRRIATGVFDHPIEEYGPDDLRAVARDVDSMRRRIVAELTASQEQERQLSELATSLDQQAIELRRSNGELEQFAYVASHDLQEPLRKVASFCQLLEKRYADSLDERGQQYIDFAVDGAKRMQVLITDLLTFSRVGRVNEGQEPVALDATIEKALANLDTAAEESGTVLTRPDRLPSIAGDPTLMVMLWQNLIGNAIKFRDPERTPAVTISCEPVVDGNGRSFWQLAVADNGIGIPAEFAEKVFVIFQRLHSRETYGGTGIGLALCKKIVEHHGGWIWIDIDHAPGTRICFTVPVAADPLDPTSSAVGSLPATDTPREGSNA
jgi:signal transduction histidine kinase